MKLYTFARAPLALAALSLSLLTLWGCPPHPGPPQPQTVSDTVAYLKFDGTLRDYSGNGHRAYPVGTIHYFTDIHADRSMALYLDGNASLRVLDTNDLHFSKSSSYTISTWVRTTDTANGTIVSWQYRNGKPTLSLDLLHGRPRLRMTAQPRDLELVSGVTVSDARWHMVTVTVAQPHTVRLYVDSTMVAQSITGNLLHTGDAVGPVSIGALPDSTHRLRTLLDEFIILRRTLQATEIPKLMQDGGAPTGPPLSICDSASATFGEVRGAADDGSVGTTLTVQSSTQGTGQWSWWNSTSTAPLYAIEHFGSQGTICGGVGTLRYTTNNGGTWTDYPSPNDLQCSEGPLTIYAIKLVSPTKVLAAGGYLNPLTQVKYRAEYYGTISSGTITWTPMITAGAGRILTITSSPDNQVWMAGDDGAILRIAKSALPGPWTSVSGIGSSYIITGIDFDPTLTSGAYTGLLVTDNGLIYDVTVPGLPSVTFGQAFSRTAAFWTARCTTTDHWAGGMLDGAALYRKIGTGSWLAWTAWNPVLVSSSCRSADGTTAYFGATKDFDVHRP